MEPVIVVDRVTGKRFQEKVFGASALEFLYGTWYGKIIAHLISRTALVSVLYGFWQNLFITKKNIEPFIKEYRMDATEFRHPVNEFRSFNDFFIRKLKLTARPIASGKNTAVMPADGRYFFFQSISEVDGFAVKGQKFNLATFLQNEEQSLRYANGTMIIARLCPTDYHRFHFPMDCVPGMPKLINGYLYSVNPLAIKQNIHIFSMNKRVVTELDSPEFGKVLYIEIGATNVGTINQTFEANFPYQKGDEKGYFSFGGSSLIILFEPNKIQLDADLTKQSQYEIFCKMGTSLGTA
jgi:phosphatidylserine decarboxylase